MIQTRNNLISLVFHRRKLLTLSSVLLQISLSPLKLLTLLGIVIHPHLILNVTYFDFPSQDCLTSVQGHIIRIKDLLSSLPCQHRSDTWGSILVSVKFNIVSMTFLLYIFVSKILKSSSIVSSGRCFRWSHSQSLIYLILMCRWALLLSRHIIVSSTAQYVEHGHCIYFNN